MPTDLTGTPTSLGIGTFNVDADAPSGLGFNEAMAQIDALIAGRLTTPAGILTGEIPVWNGSTWVRSSALGMSPSGISGYPNDVTKSLHGDGSWQNDEIAYDQITANLFTTATTSATAQTVIAGTAHTYDGKTIIAEFWGMAGAPSSAGGAVMNVGIFDETNALLGMGYLQTPVAGSNMDAPCPVKVRLTPVSGTHTYSVRGWVSTGTGAVWATSTSPAFLRISRASS